jgi:hypothetical protein
LGWSIGHFGRFDFCIMSCSKKSTDSTPTGGGGAQWTIMVYGAGNNNLDVSNNNTSYIIQDVQDMEKVGSQSGMNIIAMVTSFRTNRAKYYKVEYYPNENPDQLTSTVLEDKGSKDMSDPATLKDFINYCKANYPAQHYLLLIDDHGAGWPGSCSDELNGSGGLLTMIELKNAISQSNIQHVDIVTFHACLMAMVEVGYELRGVANYMTASQFTMPMENVLAADLWLDWLKNNPSASPYDLAHKIAEYVPQRAEFKQKTCHYAMIDLSQMTSIGSKIGNFGNILVSESGNYWSEVLHALSQTHATQYDNPAYTDLREFANKIKLEEHLSQSNLIRTGADSIIAAINLVVPYTNVYIKPGDPNVTRGGVNVHFPYQVQDFDSANYVTLEFRQTNWHAFLSTFLQSSGQTPTQGRCCYNNNQNCTVNTEAECAQLAGNWTQGIDCNTPCAQGTSCATQCAQAMAYTVGQTVNQCQFTAQATENWFHTTLGVGQFRFQLGNFPQGADYDFYTYVQCADYPSGYTQCSSAQTGPEDMTCTVSGGSVAIYILIYAYQQPYGSYTFNITQTGFGPDDGLPKIVAK